MAASMEARIRGARSQELTAFSRRAEAVISRAASLDPDHLERLQAVVASMAAQLNLRVELLVDEN